MHLSQFQSAMIQYMPFLLILDKTLLAPMAADFVAGFNEEATVKTFQKIAFSQPLKNHNVKKQFQDLLRSTEGVIPTHINATSIHAPQLV